MPDQAIKIDRNNNIVLADANGAEICIDTAHPDDIHRKLQQLASPHLALLLQIALSNSTCAVHHLAARHSGPKERRARLHTRPGGQDQR